MPKIKINKFDGIYTDVDENDTRLELFKNSVNFRHEEGFAKFEPRELSTYSLPDVASFKGDNPGTWSWERGVYAILVNDQHETIDPAPNQYRTLILVAKKLDGGTYYRSVWLKNIDSGDWVNLETISGLDNSLLATTRDGSIKFIADKGVVKLYMPHDSFWIGYLKRDSKTITSHKASQSNLIDGGKTFLFDPNRPGFDGVVDNLVVYGLSAHDNFYMDRLTEITTTQDIKDPTNTVVYFSGDNAYKPTIIDPALRLRVVSQVMPIPFSAAPENVKYKYFMARRRYESGSETGGLHLFHFEKLSSNRLPTGDDINIPVSSGYSASGLYAENYTGSGTIANCTPVNYTTGWDPTIGNPSECLDYHDAFHKLPLALQDYSGENLVASEPDYWYERITREAFFGPTDWVITGVLDETTEIVMEHDSLNIDLVDPEVPTEDEKYMVRWSINIPPNINKRVTRIKFYIKQYTYDIDKTEWLPNIDYELIEELPLLQDAYDPDNTIDLFGTASKNDLKGTLLSQNIGVLYNPATYEILTGFKDFAIESGVGVGIDYEDYINIYHSIVGGGVLQSDLVYRDTRLDLPGVAYVNALAAFNNKILAITTTTTHVISISEAAGVIAFTPLDTLEYGVKNKDDVASIQGGVVLHTKNGIFITNGFEKQLLSVQINDIVMNNYSTGTIRYNKALHEVYYRPTTSEDIYRFRIDRQKWEKLNATITQANIEDTLKDAAEES